MWYPKNKQELEKNLDIYINQESEKIPAKIIGIIVPHAGYEFSGKIAGKAFQILKNKFEKAIILGPSHNIHLNKVVTSDKFQWQTPLGKVKLFNIGFPTNAGLDKEHSIDNQIPFLQKLGIKEIMPLMVGEIIHEEAKKTAEKIAKTNAIFVFSTDLSHFLHYDNAKQIDKNTIKILENLEFENFENIDACGKYPLLIMMYLCKHFNTKPRLIEYKNSGDITNDKYHGVVGYASFYF